MSSTSEITPKSKAQRARYNISPETFVTVWQQSATADEVAEKLSKLSGKDMSKKLVLARASAYRRAGVNLKSMGQKQTPMENLDVAALNKLIKVA